MSTFSILHHVKGATYSSIPDNLRHKINVTVITDNFDEIFGTPINITKTLPELAGKKITLSYRPATEADEDVFISYIPKPHADGTPVELSEFPTSWPAYLINLKSELKIDGIVLATGTSVGMGNTETFKMTFMGPNFSTDVITNNVTAGEYLAVALDLEGISQEQMQALKTKLETTTTKLDAQDFTGFKKDDFIGDLLYSVALSYYAQLDFMDRISSRTAGIVAIRLPSEAIFSIKLSVDSFFGIPMSISSGGLVMDVGRIMTLLKALDGNKDKAKDFLLTSGLNSSALEHLVPEQLFSIPDKPATGISAVKALKIANDQGIPIYTINRTNISTILPQLQVDENVKADIQNTVNAGKEVTVSKTNITFNGWIGCGYIIINPSTGAGAYMLSGGFSGSQNKLDQEEQKHLDALHIFFTAYHYKHAALEELLEWLTKTNSIVMDWIGAKMIFIFVYIDLIRNIKQIAQDDTLTLTEKRASALVCSSLALTAIAATYAFVRSSLPNQFGVYLSAVLLSSMLILLDVAENYLLIKVKEGGY